MKSFTLWMEGFRVMEGSAEASYLGEYTGETLLDAYLKYVKDEYGSKPPEYVNLTKPIIWGCRVFDNEKDARSSFG